MRCAPTGPRVMAVGAATVGEQALAEHAPAKVNLSLAILGRRADGYHELESLVVFAGLADRLQFLPDAPLGLALSGPGADACGPDDANLVLKAARALAAARGPLRLGGFKLAKNLPVAAGLGGGSADAAAALRLLARANAIPADDPSLLAAARATGADVPVCVDPRPRIMRGIGDLLSDPLDLPALPAVLVNPGVAVPTRDVFAALRLLPGQRLRKGEQGFAGIAPQALSDRTQLFAALDRNGNDLEQPAIALQPVIGKVLKELRELPDCRLARMSGSGATCFGVFATAAAARAAAAALKGTQPAWWVRDTTLGAG